MSNYVAIPVLMFFAVQTISAKAPPIRVRPTPAMDALFACELDESIRLTELNRTNKMPSDSDVIAHKATIACDSLFEAAYVEQMNLSGDDPKLEAKIKRAQRQTDRRTHRTPAQSAALGRGMVKAFGEVGLAEMIADPNFPAIAARRKEMMKSNASNP